MSPVDMGPASLDPAERDYYERRARLWWDPAGPFWPLHRLNALRVAYLRDRLAARHSRDPGAERPLDDLRILDIGCGGGLLSESVARLGATVLGVDPVAGNIRTAELHAAGSGLPVTYATGSAEGLADAGARFDVVLNMEVVEHVSDLPSFLDACARLVDADGVMFVATINRTPLAWLTAILGAEYVLGWLPRGTHHWRKLRRPAEVEALLAPAGLHPVDRRGVRVNPFNRRFSLTGFLGVNYMLELERRMP